MSSFPPPPPPLASAAGGTAGAAVPPPPPPPSAAAAAIPPPLPAAAAAVPPPPPPSGIVAPPPPPPITMPMPPPPSSSPPPTAVGPGGITAADVHSHGHAHASAGTAGAAAATANPVASAAESTLAFLRAMIPPADALLQGLSAVEASHPLAELLYETAMTLREALNLYAASSPSLCAAVSVNQAILAAEEAASPESQASSLPPPPPPPPCLPRLHDSGLESLWTRNHKVQTILQQRMWTTDRVAGMSHRTQVEVATATVSSAAQALQHGVAPSSSQLPWTSLVVYKKGHELLALDTHALSSLNLGSASHLGTSFANASNVGSWTGVAPVATSPFKLLLDLRWVSGVREVNAANANSSKELGCELLLKFVDAPPLGSSHALASTVVTNGGGGAMANAQGMLAVASPDRFLHMRFATDAERQRIAHVIKAALAKNQIHAQISRAPIPQRIGLWRELGLLPPGPPPSVPLTSAGGSRDLIFVPTAALSSLEHSFLFLSKFSPPDNGLSVAPTGHLGLALPVPATPAQTALTCTPFVTVFPVIWPQRESTLLAKHKARVLEFLIYPHQSQPIVQSMLQSSAFSSAGAAPGTAWNGPRHNQMRIWKPRATGKGGEGGSGSGSAGSGSGSGAGGSGGSGGSGDSRLALLHGWSAQGLTGSYGDTDEKECSITITPAELVDFKCSIDTLEIELTCFVPHKGHSGGSASNGFSPPPKGAPAEEGAWNGRNTRPNSICVPNAPGAGGGGGTGNAPGSLVSAGSSSTTLMAAHLAAQASLALAAAASASGGSAGAYTTRKFIFHSPFHLRKFLESLRWFQATHREPTSIQQKLMHGDALQLKLREWNDRTSRPPSLMIMPPAATTTTVKRSLSSDTAAGSPSGAAPVSAHLHTLLWSMYQSFPSSKHCADLWLLTKDLPQTTKEGALERMQLIVRKLFACGYGTTAPAPASQPPLPGQVEKGTGMGGPGDVRAIVCTCPNALHTRNPTGAAPPARAPPPSPSGSTSARSSFGSSSTSSPSSSSTGSCSVSGSAPPSRPPPAINSCYIFFYQIFLKCSGFQDLRHVLLDNDQGSPNRNSAIKRWALRGMWALFEFVKPLLSASNVPAAMMPPNAGGVSSPPPPGSGQANPASGSLKGGYHSHSASGSGGSGSASIDLSSIGGAGAHWALTTFSLARCKNKLLTVWEEDSSVDSGIQALFKTSFAGFVVGLVQPGHRITGVGPPLHDPLDPSADLDAFAKPSRSFIPPIAFHESLLDVLFEIAVNNIRLDMVYSSTSTIEPITSYVNPNSVSTSGSGAGSGAAGGANGAPGSAPTLGKGVSMAGSGGSGSNSGSRDTASTSQSQSAFASYNLKRESRVQVLNKPLVHWQLIPLILHLLPYAPLAASILTLENFTWLLNASGGSPNPNIASLLWNMVIGNGNMGGNFFILIQLANQYMEAAALAGANDGSGKLRKQASYSTVSSSNALQKGSWDIFLDTAAPDSSIVMIGDPSLVFNLTITLFTTVHYQSMLIHQNSSNMFLGASAGSGLSAADSPAAAAAAAAAVAASAASLASAGLSSSSCADATDGTSERDRVSLSLLMVSSCDSAEKLRFRTMGLFKSLESLRSLNGWNESSTSLFRVMIICLLNVLRSEARAFTGNFDLSNNASNLFCYNQFLVLTYVIEEFIFFRPIHAAMHTPLAQSSSANGSAGGSSGGGSDGASISASGSLQDNAEEDEYSSLGLHFDFGDDFDWSDGGIEALGAASLGGGGHHASGGYRSGSSSSSGHHSSVSSDRSFGTGSASISSSASIPAGDNKGNLGRVLDVPVIDKLLDTFVALKLANPSSMPPSNLSDEKTSGKEKNDGKVSRGDKSDGKGEKDKSEGGGNIHSTATVIGDGSVDKYERKMLDLFAKEYRVWHDYRTLLRLLSRANMAQNYRAQTEHSSELLMLVRKHQDERLKTLTSLGNYSKKSSGFFGSGFGSNKSPAWLRANFGLKLSTAPGGSSTNPGSNITLYPHLFGLINRTIQRAKLEGMGLGARASVAANASSFMAAANAAAVVKTNANGGMSMMTKGGDSPSGSSSNLAALEAHSNAQQQSNGGSGGSLKPGLHRQGSHRASLLLNTNARVQILASGDANDKSAAAAAMLLQRSRRTFQSIRHAKDFCEKERRRSSVFQMPGSSPLHAFGAQGKNSGGGGEAGKSNGTLGATPSASPEPLSPSSGRNNPKRGTAPLNSPVLGAAQATVAAAAAAGAAAAATAVGDPMSPSPSPSPQSAKVFPPPPPSAGVQLGKFPPPPPPPSKPLGTAGGKPSKLLDLEDDDATVTGLGIGTGAAAAAGGSPSNSSFGGEIGGALSCTLCSSVLSSSNFFERHGLPYCAPCFLKRFLSCLACGERILFASDGLGGPEESAEEARLRAAREASSADGGASTSQPYLTLGEERIVHHRCLKCESCQKALCPPVAALAPAPGAATPGSPSSSTASGGNPLGSVSLFQHSGSYYCQSCYFARHGKVCAHCDKVIATSQSIQLAPEEEDDADQSGEAQTRRGASASQPPVFFHLECFVCNTCKVDLRMLEAAQDEADEAAFAAGRAVNTEDRPPTYASDLATRKVYCWKHFNEPRPAGNAAAAGASPPPLPVTSNPLAGVLSGGGIGAALKANAGRASSSSSSGDLSSLISEGDAFAPSHGAHSYSSGGGGGLGGMDSPSSGSNLAPVEEIDDFEVLAHSYSRSRS